MENNVLEELAIPIPEVIQALHPKTSQLFTRKLLAQSIKSWKQS